jgi:hypothetical protein
MNTVGSDKLTTKVCPICGNDQLLLFSTLKLKSCTECHVDILWHLEDRQEQLIKYQR